MDKYIDFRNTKIAYRVLGNAEKTLVFLHGYLEAKEIWNEFAEKLSKEYKLVLIDMLGHGNSGTIANEHKMSLMAEAVNSVLDNENISNCIMFGHSMGGYVTLEFAKNYKEKLKAFCLFHSQAYADTDEKKKNREREIKLVKGGKYNLIVETNIPNMYAEGTETKFSDKLEFSKEIARRIKPEGVIAALNGMKTREENLDAIRNSEKPMLFIAGKKDNLIPYIADDKQFSLNPKMEILLLENSGHMGMFEESEKAFNAIHSFIKKNYNV